jgi:hypothetical protein
MEVIQQKQELDQETRHRVKFYTFIITMFARAYKMNKPQAYLYLEKYGGLNYLYKHWWTLHTEDTYWSLKSLYSVCRKNGGLK